MSVKNYRFCGQRKLDLKQEATGAGENKAQKQELLEKMEQNLLEIAELQEKLYAEGREGLVIAIQARDAAGKDSLIKHVFGRLNPAALEIHSFKAPNSTELSHDFLWRINQALPPRGTIGVFNRSQYEDVLVVRVHHMESNYKMPERFVSEDFYRKRYQHLKNWEEYLYANGYRMIKVFLNVSRDTQKKRFLDRIERDDKHYKLSTNDMKERALWKEYDEAYEDCINATGTPESPWYVLPADNKWYTRYLMTEVLLEVLKDMDPQFPPLDPSEAAKLPMVLAELERQ